MKCSNKAYCLFVFLFIFLFAAAVANAQTGDTSIPKTWDKFHMGIRTGAGIQRSFYTEIGLSLQRFIYARNGFVASTIYTAFEWTPTNSGGNAVSGIKVGAEIVTNGSAGGIEIKYLANSQNKDVVITPKIGLGMGFINAFYGYNFSTNKYPFPNIGKSQFSLVINTNILFHHLKFKGK